MYTCTSSNLPLEVVHTCSGATCSNILEPTCANGGNVALSLTSDNNTDKIAQAKSGEYPSHLIVVSAGRHPHKVEFVEYGVAAKWRR